MSQETQEEKALRPKNLANFIGQDHAKPNLEVYLRSAKARGAALDHVLICGPAGLGKTSLSEVIAHELGTRLVYVFAPSIKNVRDLIIILAGLQERDVLFIDEIHALDPTVEEILYPATEDQKLRFTSNNTPININLPSFTLIGATTRAGMLQKPMLDRFGITIEMQPYTDEQLATIIKNNAPKLGIQATDDGALELARRSRGVPRIANRMLRRVRDFVLCAGNKTMDLDIVNESCNRLGVDSMGVDVNMLKYLRILQTKKVPMALKTLAAVSGESIDTLENVIEPHLMTIGFIEKTSKGRVLTSAGSAHIA